MTIKAVLFDFDGTLADTLLLSIDAFKTVFKVYDNREISTEEIVAMFGPTEDEIIRRNLIKKEFASEAIEQYYQIYKEGHASFVQKSDDIEMLLMKLKEKGIKTGIITGKSRLALQISSEALKLSQYYDIAITGDDVREPKPHPEGIFTALATFNVAKEEAVFIGDSSADIKAGRAAGLRTFGVKWLPTVQSTTFEVEPDDLFTSVDQLLALLENASVTD